MGWDRITDPVPAIFFENTDRAGLTRSVRVLDHPVAYPVERTFRPRTDTRTHACCWSLHFCVVALTGAALGVRPGSVDVVATLAGSGVGLAHDAASTHGITTIGDACTMDVTSRGGRYLLTLIRTVERNQPCGRM